MGQELACRLHREGRTCTGKAQLETDYLLFRGEERLKLHFRDLQSVHAQVGMLHLEYPGGPAVFELGNAAEKWAQKILHPPTRADKLGIHTGLMVRVEGEFPADFLAELEPLRPAGKQKADLLFFAAPATASLARVPKLAFALAPAGSLWIVYPKGVDTIREIDVLQAGRAAGLKDTKVASFSATHTALRFVIPVAARAR